MKAAPHIVLCTEADATVGLGHAVRCAGLLRQLTLDHTLSVIGGGPVLKALLPHARHVDAPNCTRAVWADIDLPAVDLVLADIPYQRSRDWECVRHPDAALIVIDDHGGTVPADVVINGTVLPAYQDYDAVRPPGKLYVGPNYALIRPEFAATPWRRPTNGPLTVVAGSGAPARDWLLELVRPNSPLLAVAEVQVVVGAAFDALTELRRSCDGSGIALHVGLDAASLAALLAGSGAALLTAGMVLYEAVAAGVPTVAFPQIADLVPEAHWFSERGACIDLGPEGGTPAAAAMATARLLGLTPLARDMSRRQRELLDGLGMARVAGILAAHLESRT